MLTFLEKCIHIDAVTALDFALILLCGVLYPPFRNNGGLLLWLILLFGLVTTVIAWIVIVFS